MDFIQVARKLIAHESSPSTGNQALARELVSFMHSLGLEVQIQEQAWAGHPQLNIWAKRKQDSWELPWLLLQAHLDTADPGPFAEWTRTDQNPFDAHVIDSYLYGLGAADAKIDFLCKLEALRSWSQPATGFCPVLLGTFSEEQGMMGALKFIRKNGPRVRWALVGEATGLRMVTAAKGLAVVEIRIPFEEEEILLLSQHNQSENTSTQSKLFRGRAAHSSRPQDGESAIHKMLDYLLMLPQDITIMEIDGGQNYNTIASHAFMEFDIGSQLKNNLAQKLNRLVRVIHEIQEEFPSFNDADFEPSQPTLNIGSIRTFADHVSISGTCRLPPSVQQADYESWMRRLQEVCLEIHSDFRIVDYKRPFRTPEDAEILRVAQETLEGLGLSTQSGTLPLTNEASLFSRLQVETFCFGPGHHEGNLHTPQERVSLQNLQTAVVFYRNFLEKFNLRRIG